MTHGIIVHIPPSTVESDQVPLQAPERTVMPFVNIDLLRGKSPEYLKSVSDAVHGALVEGLGMLPGDRFQVINQHEPWEMDFNRNFRGGPRSDDFIIFTITDGLDRGEVAKQKFYKALVRNLAEGPQVNPADVFVMVYLSPPVNFSFADGVIGSEVAAAEALDRSATVPGTRDAYTKTELADAFTRLFRDSDPSRILPMLRDDFVLTAPAALPYGGKFTGPKEFDAFYARLISGEFYDSFVTGLRRVINGDDHLIAQITSTTSGNAADDPTLVESAWVFDIEGGKFVRATLYTDTAAGLGAGQ
jgi:hypothetical protein